MALTSVDIYIILLFLVPGFLSHTLSDLICPNKKSRSDYTLLIKYFLQSLVILLFSYSFYFIFFEKDSLFFVLYNPNLSMIAISFVLAIFWAPIYSFVVRPRIIEGIIKKIGFTIRKESIHQEIYDRWKRGCPIFVTAFMADKTIISGEIEGLDRDEIKRDYVYLLGGVVRKKNGKKILLKGDIIFNSKNALYIQYTEEEKKELI